MSTVTSPDHPLLKAIELVGKARLAAELKITYQSFNYWLRANRMPRTEWTGETGYAAQIERLTGGEVTKAMLLAAWPQPEPLKEAA